MQTFKEFNLKIPINGIKTCLKNTVMKIYNEQSSIE